MKKSKKNAISPPVSSAPATRAPRGRKKSARPPTAWRRVDRAKLALLLGVHPDTVTDFARDGMPAIARGGRGELSVYDAVECLDWWRERQGKNAKEIAQTALYRNNAELAALKIQVQKGELLPREQVLLEGQAFVKGWTAQIRALPRRARQAGVVPSASEEAILVDLCRSVLADISSWRTSADIERAGKDADAA